MHPAARADRRVRTRCATHYNLLSPLKPLPGLLVFIADDEPTLQILVASIISLVSLQLYVRFSPFMDDDVDSISTIAQLMTFTQLFLALLMSSGVIQDYAPESFCAFALGGMSVVHVGPPLRRVAASDGDCDVRDGLRP